MTLFTVKSTGQIDVRLADWQLQSLFDNSQIIIYVHGRIWSALHICQTSGQSPIEIG